MPSLKHELPLDLIRRSVRMADGRVGVECRAAFTALTALPVMARGFLEVSWG